MVLYKTYLCCCDLLIWLVTMATKLKIWEKILKNSLCKNIVFIAVAQELWLLWQLKVSIDLQWKKWKLRFIAILLEIFWQKFYRNVPGVVLYKPYAFCLTCWFWSVAMATEMIIFEKKKKKKFNNLLLRSHKRDAAKPLHKCFCHYPLHKLCFSLLLRMWFRCYGNLKFPYIYNGKSEVGLYFCLTLGILTKAFQ